MDGFIIGLTVPLLGTILGAACVYALKNTIPPLAKKFFMGFTAGVMIAAAVWSLIIPSMEMTGGSGFWHVMPTTIGFILGVAFLLLMDRLTPHRHSYDNSDEGPRSSLSRTWKLVLAIILHNIPEGMAIGVAFAAVFENSAWLSAAGALALSIGIAIQNFPEGAIVSIPLKDAGNSSHRSFAIGVASGIVQPVAAITTVLLASAVVPAMPYLLAFAAGAMLYVVVEELIPASAKGPHTNHGPLGFALGFILMIVLDALLN